YTGQEDMRGWERKRRAEQSRVEQADGKFTNSYTYKDAEKDWTELATILNSIPGANKNWKQWRKTWQDMRCRTKSKASKNKINREGTGGGPFIEDSLTKVEEDIIDIIKIVSVEGHENVKESIVEFNMEFETQKNDENDCNFISETQSSNPSINRVEISEDHQNKTPSAKNGKEWKSRKIAKRTPTRLKHTTAAIESYEKHLDKKLAIKEKYYEEKLKILSEMVVAKTQCASALQRIAEALENL
ncbi:hypothetical protein NQ314_004538, partial [Rhamnusium bicolor]